MRHLKTIEWYGVIKKCTESYLTGLLVILTLHAMWVIFFLDPYNYVEYESVEPSRAEVQIGHQELFFISTSDVKRKSTIEWSDILRCDIAGDGLRGGYFSKYKSDKTNSPAGRYAGDSIWRYGADIPIEPAVCDLRSTTFVVFKIFLFIDYPKPLDPIYSKKKVDFVTELSVDN